MDDLTGAYESAMGAEGSAMRENETFLNSIEGRIKKFTTAVQTMWSNFINDDVVKFIVDVGTALVQLADTIGLIPTALGAFTAFGIVKDTIKQDFADIGDAIKNAMNISGEDIVDQSTIKKAAQNVSDAVNAATQAPDTQQERAQVAVEAMEATQESVVAEEQAAEAIQNSTDAIVQQNAAQEQGIALDHIDNEADATGAVVEGQETAAITGNTTATEQNTASNVRNIAADHADNIADAAGAVTESAETAAINANTAATTANTVAQKAGHALLSLGKGLLAGLGVGLATAAVSALIGLVVDAFQAEEKAIERANEALNTYKEEQKKLDDQKETVDELAESYTRLSGGVNTLTNDNIGLTTEAYQEYLEVCNDIAAMFPELVSGYDAQGNAIIDLKGDVDALTQSYINAQKEAAATLLTAENKDDIWTKFTSNDMMNAGVSKTISDEGYDMYDPVSLQTQKEILETVLSMAPTDLREFYERDHTGLDTQYDILGEYGLDSAYDRGAWIDLDIPAKDLDFDEYQEYIREEIAERDRIITDQMSGMRDAVSASLLLDPIYQDLDEDARGIVQTIINTMDPNMIIDSGAKNFDQFVTWFRKNVIDKAAGNADMYSGLTDASNDMAKAMSKRDADAFEAAKAEFMELIPENWFDENGNIIVDPDADPVTQYLQQLAKDMQNKAKNFEVRMAIHADVDIKNPKPISDVVDEYVGDAQDEIRRAINDLELGEDATLGDIFGTIGVNLDINDDGKLRVDEIQDVYDDYLSYMAGDTTAMDQYTTGQREAAAALHYLAQLYGTDVDTIIAAMVELEFAFESLDGVKSFDLESESTNEFVDKFQSDVDTIKDAWESLNSGEMTQSDFLDLAQEFPELMEGVDFSDDNWMTKARANLEALNKTTVDDFITELNEMKEAMAARGEDTTIIDSMIAFAEKQKDMSQVVAEVQANTITGLTEVHERYKTIMEETNEILYNGQKVSDGYYESLAEYIDDTEALNACFDENNKQIVTNVDALKELIDKQHEADTQTVRLAKSQAQLRYYELVRQLGDTTRSMDYFSAASDTTVDALLDQIGTVKDAIAQYQLLEDNLLGTTSAFEKFAKAKELDDQNTYGASYAEMAQAMYDALYETGQVGSAQFWAAVEATVPDDIYKHLTPGTEQIRAVYDYFNKNIMPTLTFDEDSFSLDYTDIEAFIKKAQEVGVFSGTDATSFGLSSDFFYGLAEGENALEAFAERMGMTTAQVYAMLSEMDKYTTDGVGLSMLLQLDTSTSGQITYITSELEKLYAQRRALLTQGASDSVLESNMAEIYEYESQLAGLQKQAVDTVQDYIVVRNAIVDTSKKVNEVLPTHIITELGLDGDKTVQEQLGVINDYILKLQEPTVMELEIASQNIESELSALATRFSEEELEANVELNEDGLYEVKNGVLTIDAGTMERYVELKNAQLFIDEALMSSLSTQELLLTSIDKNVATIAGTEPASVNNDGNTQGEISTAGTVGATTDMPSGEKPAPDQESALLTLNTSKDIGTFARAVSEELAAEEQNVGHEGSIRAIELSNLGNRALQLQDDLLDGKIFAEDAIARLSELKTEASYWDVEIPATLIIKPKELEASAEEAADGLTITPDVDLENRPYVPFNSKYFNEWESHYEDIALGFAHSDDFKKQASDIVKSLDRGDSYESFLPQIYYKEDLVGLGDGENDSALVLTPILPDGTVLSPQQLEEYAEQLFRGQEISPDITLGFFNGENYGAQAEAFVISLNKSQAALYGMKDGIQEATSEIEALYGVYASPEDALAALEAIEDKTYELTPEEALAFGWTLGEGEILTAADAIKRLRSEIDATRQTSIYNPEQFQESVIMIKTLSELQEEVSGYNEILTQTEEIISDNIEVSQEYKDSLENLGITEEELNACFDDGNPLLVTNAKLLNKLVKTAKNNVATNIKLAKSQAQLEYYELYKEMAKLTDGTQEINGETLNYIQSLYGQMGAVQKTIAQFSMLEAQLLGATNAYEQLEAAQAADSANDYGSKAEELVNILGNAFNTAELGTQAAQTAIAGLIPDDVIDKTKTLDEQMEQIYEYFTKGQVSKLFTIEFDDEGNISSVDMTKENVEAFTKELIEAGEVFHGTWDEFTLDPSIKTLDDFAEALGVTKEVAFAYLTELEKYDINWLGGDHETLLDQLMGDNFEYQIQKTMQRMAQLQQEKAALLEGGIDDDEAARLAEINAELANLDGTMAEHRETAYDTWQEYSNNENILTALDQIGDKTATLNEAEALELGLEWDEDKTVQEYYDEILAKQVLLGQPTELILQFAKEQAMAELDALKADLEGSTGVDIDANVHFNDETGEFEYAGDTTGWTEKDIANLQAYLDLSGDLYDINKSLGLGIEAMEGYAQRTADAVESIDQKITGDGNGEGESDVNGVDVDGYTPETKNATVFYTVDGTALEEYTPENKSAFVVYNPDGEPVALYDPETKQATVLYGPDGTALEEYTPENKSAFVVYDADGTAVAKYNPETKYATVIYTATYDDQEDTPTGGSGVHYTDDGTMHGGGGGRFGDGTAHAQGTAHKGGSWGAPKTETALVGELGPEIRVRGNRWELLGENGAEFRDVRKGDIIFNSKQSEQLLTNGYITGRGKAFAEGTIGGSAFAGINTWDDAYGTLGDDYGNQGSDAADDLSDAASDAADEFREVFDWIAVRIEEINEKISLKGAELENAVGSSAQNAVIDDMIALNQKLYDNLTAGAAKYNAYAAKLLAKVPAEYRKAAQNGTIAIEEFVGEVDEETLNAIQEYREWVQKGADATQQAEETLTEISNLAKQAIDNIAQDYENKSSFSEGKIGQFEAYNALIETDIGYESAGIYQAMIAENNRNIGILEKQRDAMQAELNKRVESGEIKVGSQNWYDAINDIAAVDTEIIDLKTNTENWQDAINDLHWEKFDSLIGRLQSVSEEADNLIDILGNSDMVDEAGNWTDEGITSLGLYAQQMEAAEVEAKKYQDEIDYLNKNWQKLGYTEDEYLERLGELKDGQYAAIQSYHDSKDAIVDMTKARVDAIKEGIEAEIESTEELINKKKEELSAEKDLYDFQKNIASSQKNIAEIQRKLAALSGDNSASARAKRAQLEAELAEAQQELSDTYYDRSVSNQQDALDKELEDFQNEKDAEMEAWDEYLENAEQVVADSLATIQENTETVYNTLQAMGEEYGLSITESLTSPWQEGENAIQSFSEKFGVSMSATVEELQQLEVEFLETMAEIELAGKDAATTVRDNFKGYKEAEKAPEQPGGGGSGNGGGSGGSSNTGMVSGLSGNIQYGQSGDKVKKLQQALNDLGFNCGAVDGKFGINTLAAVKKFQQSSKYGGAITADGVVGTNTKKKFKVAGYASGTTGVKNDQLALIDEFGLEELVMHAGPGGRLQYLTKGSAVIPHDISENLVELGQLDPSAILDRNRPVISTHPEIHQTEINLNISYGDVLHIDEYNGGKPEDLTKIIAKEFDKHLKNVNQHIRRYSK